jgi:RNA polymerase sigma-70 factor (ECF subfamily)
MKTLQTDDFIPTRYSLLSRLENWEDQESWKDFFDTYWRLIYSVALKSGLSDAEAQDVVQETIIAVAKNIQKFKRDRTLGSFKGWLRNLTRWRIADQLRQRTNATAAPSDLADDGSAGWNPAEIADSSEAEAIWDDEWRLNLMKVALNHVKGVVKEEHYQMFDLYVVKQWPAEKVARTLDVHVGQVYLAKYRVAALVKKEIRRLETSELQSQ